MNWNVISYFADEPEIVSTQCVWHQNKRNQPTNQSIDQSISQSVFHVVLRVLAIFRHTSDTNLTTLPCFQLFPLTPVTWGSALLHARGSRNSQRSHISFIKIYFTGTDFWVQPVSIRPQQTRNGSFRTIKEVQEVQRAPETRCGPFPLFWLKAHKLTWLLFLRCGESVHSVYRNLRRAGGISDTFMFFHRQKIF